MLITFDRKNDINKKFSQIVYNLNKIMLNKKNIMTSYFHNRNLACYNTAKTLHKKPEFI